ncbi:unnamed protein product [Cuscuta campestris]|uniref:Uncharacterized protein n=1 Tax=Cuscuta campestris TaxID=132261 RepID=A0A484N8X0_9ASTE|nr:unnamed protein product [Cuscuta campestris]
MLDAAALVPLASPSTAPRVSPSKPRLRPPVSPPLASSVSLPPRRRRHDLNPSPPPMSRPPSSSTRPPLFLKVTMQWLWMGLPLLWMREIFCTVLLSGVTGVVQKKMRCHHHCEESKLYSSELTEVYSIFIGRKRKKALKILGTVELSSEYHSTQHYVFKSTSNDGVEVENSQKVYQ